MCACCLFGRTLTPLLDHGEGLPPPPIAPPLSRLNLPLHIEISKPMLMSAYSRALYIYGFCAASCYGILFCSAKYLLLTSPITIFELLYVRSFFAMIILFPILFLYDISIFEIPRHVSFYLFLRCLTGFIGFSLQFFATKFTDLSKIVILIYNPFISSLMSFCII